jgi:hypothetical protein
VINRPRPDRFDNVGHLGTDCLGLDLQRKRTRCGALSLRGLTNCTAKARLDRGVDALAITAAIRTAKMKITKSEDVNI